MFQSSDMFNSGHTAIANSNEMNNKFVSTVAEGLEPPDRIKVTGST